MQFNFTGSVEAPSGKVIYKHVSGSFLTHALPGSLHSWDGRFSILSGEPALVHPETILVTSTGGRADLAITRVSPQSPVVEFQGSGPPP